MTPGRELRLGITIVLILVAGFAIELFASEVAAPAARPLPGVRFVERAHFCPPAIDGVRSFTVSSAVDSEAVSLGLEPARPDRVELAADQLFVQELPGKAAADVVGYGAPVRAGALLRARSPVVGEGAARCSDRSSSHWFFAAGASTLGVDERLLIYNPFPDEAVVRVTFLTPHGEERKGNLADVAVPSKSSTIVRVNDFIRLERALGVRIDTKRGRVVAWRMMFDRPEEGPHGAQLSLGASATSDTWYFPEGAVTPSIEERISLINPGQEEATVTISLTSGEEMIQPPRLVAITVAPGTARSVTLNDELRGAQKDLGGVSAIVQSTNGAGIVAERSMRYGTPPVLGSASEIGAPRAAPGWWLPPASLNPKTDTIVVMNPGAAEATVDLEILYAEGASKAPAELQERAIPPGGRVKISISEWTALETTIVRLRASSPVVAERLAFSDVPQDVGAILGYPLE